MDGHDAKDQSVRLNVFISYSREDNDFADQLEAALRLFGFDTSIDRQGISAGEDWKRRLGALIRDADSVVFILSPSSAQSKTCAWEVAEAVRLGKRIIPLVCRPLDGAAAPTQLADLNYIFFYAHPTLPGSGFGTGQTQLVTALRTDIDWLREHTRLLQRASEWELGGRPENRLLSGADVAAAKTWATQRPKGAPEPTALHMDFIRASEGAEVARVDATRRQLVEMAAAQDERAKALAAAEGAQKERDAAARRVVKRTLVGLAASLALAVLAAFSAYRANQFSLDAEKQSKTAVEKATEAERQTMLAEMQRRNAIAQAERAKRSRALAEQATSTVLQARDANQSADPKLLSVLAQQEIEDGNTATGLLLALEAGAAVQRGAVADKTAQGQVQASVDTGINNLAEQRILSGHEAAVLHAVLTHDGKRLVTAAADATVRVWDMTSGKVLSELTDLGAIALSRDDRRLVSSQLNGGIQVRDLATGAKLSSFDAPKGVNYLVLSEAEDVVIASFADKSIRAYDLASGSEKLKIDAGRNVTRVAIGPNNRIYAPNAGGHIAAWDLSTGKQLMTFDTSVENPLEVVVVAGERVVAGGNDGTVRIWNIATGALQQVLEAHVEPVTALAASRNGERIYSASREGIIRIWDTATGADLATLRGHRSQIGALTLLNDGEQIVSASRDRTVRLWSPVISNGATQFTGHQKGVMAVAVSPDGSLVASGSQDETVRLWDLKQNAERRKIELGGQVGTVAFSPDGMKLLTGNSDYIAQIWDIDSGRELLKVQIGEPVGNVRWLGDGSRFVTASYNDKSAAVWNSATGVKLFGLEGNEAKYSGLATSADGSRIVTGETNGTVRIWDATTGKTLAKLVGHRDVVTGVDISRDGRRIATGGWDKSVRLWDAITGKQIAILNGHKAPVWSVAFSPDGRHVISGSFDRNLAVWDAGTGALIKIIEGHSGPVMGVAVTADGKNIISGSDDGTVRVWPMFSVQGDLYAEARQRAPRCLSPSERKKFYLAPIPPAWCAELGKWPYDAAGYALEARALIDAGLFEEAKIILDAVTGGGSRTPQKRDPAVADTYFNLGKKLPNPQDSEAAFQSALAFDTSIAPQIGEQFFNRAKDVLLEGGLEPARRLFAMALKVAPTLKQSVRDLYLLHGRTIMTFGHDEDANRAFAQALTLDPEAQNKVTESRAEGFLKRGAELLANDKPTEARTAIDRAYEHFGEAGPDHLLSALLEAASDRMDKATLDDVQTSRLIAAAEKLIPSLEAKSPLRSKLLFSRGRLSHLTDKYREAVVDLTEAAALGHANAPNWLWWSTYQVAYEDANQGRLVDGLLLGWTNLLDMKPTVRKTIETVDLKNASAFGEFIGRLGASLRQGIPASGRTDCDVHASHIGDPQTIAEGKIMAKIDAARAIEACDAALKATPDNARLQFERGRAHLAAAYAARARNDTASEKSSFAAGAEDLDAAVAKGYAAAYLSLASLYDTGDGVPKDAEKAADLKVGYLNHTLACCAATVVRHLFSLQDPKVAIRARRVGAELLKWAAALGNQDARALYLEVFPNANDIDAAATATLDSLPPWYKAH